MYDTACRVTHENSRRVTPSTPVVARVAPNPALRGTIGGRSGQRLHNSCLVQWQKGSQLIQAIAARSQIAMPQQGSVDSDAELPMQLLHCIACRLSPARHFCSSCGKGLCSRCANSMFTTCMRCGQGEYCVACFDACPCQPSEADAAHEAPRGPEDLASNPLRR